jgi:RRXRR protein
MQVAVIDQNRKPLAPTSAVRARLLLKKGKAAVFRRAPLTIILLKRVVEEVQVPKLRLKLDPGSRKTGVAIVNQRSGEVIFAAEIEHRGEAIKQALAARRAIRRSRRSRKTRYRKARFLNRRRPEGWLPPSLKSRISNIETWVKRLTCCYPIAGISMELVKFDTQLLENPEISGIEYQQGELAGYEVREYLLEKWGRKCAYCSETDVPRSGSFNVTTAAGTIQGISHRYCLVIHRADGYGINRAIARSQNSSPSKLTKMFAMEGVSF